MACGPKFESKAVRLCLAPPTRVSDERRDSAVPPRGHTSVYYFPALMEEELSGISRPQDPLIQRGSGHNAVAATCTSSHGPVKESKYKEREAD